MRKMALTCVQSLILVLSAASMLGASVGSKDWQSGYWGYWGPKRGSNANNTPPRRIIVGGDQNWTFGFNYANWTIQNAPFYLNDTLVFKYDPPSETNIHPHSVYLLPHIWSYKKCDLTGAEMVANVSDGAGEGFEFVLKTWRPYYFACGGGNGIHCNNGTMKFIVTPLLRSWHY